MAKRINTAVILAAGRGVRLQPLTYDVPKGLITVGDETLIERSIRILKENGIQKIIIGTGHLREMYDRLSGGLEFETYINRDFATTGSFHTLCEGQKLITEDFLLLESDLIYDPTAIRAIMSTKLPDSVLCSGFTNSADEVFVEINRDGNLQNLSKNKAELESADAELVGIWKLSYELYKKLLNYSSTNKDAKTMDYERAIADLSHERAIHACVTRELVWAEIDDNNHLERVKYLILPKL